MLPNMTLHTALVFLLLFATLPRGLAKVLIIADEFPAMETLAAKLRLDENISSELVWQTNLPATLSPCQAVIIYVHHDLLPVTENALMNYAEQGGKLLVLHHSVASGKRKNKRWFPFLGVSLPEGSLEDGGYKWIEGVHWQGINLNPGHFIMTNKVVYPERIPYSSTNRPLLGADAPGFTLQNSEVYLNHVHTESHTLLMGLKYLDKSSGITYMQDRAGWIKRAGKGWIVYFMPGHSARDFENPTYGQIVLNAVIWRPP